MDRNFYNFAFFFREISLKKYKAQLFLREVQ